MVEAVNRARPDALFVAMTAPKQELWLSRHRRELDVLFAMGVGAAFDFVARTKVRAPPLFGRLGLEWLYRLVHEPSRLWRRNVSSVVFLWLLAGTMARRFALPASTRATRAEVRSSFRHPARLAVLIGELRALTVNVGQGGLCLDLDHGLPRGSSVEGSICIGRKSLAFTGQVAWMAPGDEPARGRTGCVSPRCQESSWHCSPVREQVRRCSPGRDEMRTRERAETGDSGRHVLTFAIEDYFQAGALHGVVHPRHWSRFEKRVEQSTRLVLDLLDACQTRATFFVLGWIADELPELVRELVQRGHDVASKGYHHRALHELDREEFRTDLLRSREAIERAGGRRVRGYRIARGSFGLFDLWALDVLAEEGFAYDSSFYPRLRSIGSEAWRRFPFEHRRGAQVIREYPLSSVRVAGLSIPLAGGNYFRQLPHAVATTLLDQWTARTEQPFILHFHIWELDPALPFITAANPIAKVRQHRNVGKMLSRLEDHLRRHAFGSIADHLGLAPEAIAEPTLRTAPSAAPLGIIPRPYRTPVTIVVPCFNEEQVLPYLANTLAGVKRCLQAYELSFVFVDDGSTDGTLAELRRVFGDWPDCKVVCRPRNEGVARAIMAGMEAATTDVVCSIDCDCTYDPRQLEAMLPLLGPGVDLVTASPYHRLGAVHNVPQWRLFLSRGLSSLYRLVLREQLATFTSCFRVYRRSAFLGLRLEEGGFLGVAEMIGLLALRGSRIVECPALLEVRMLGRSKMKVLWTILGHLRLLARFSALRLRGGKLRPLSNHPLDGSQESSKIADAVNVENVRRSGAAGGITHG